MKPNTELNRLNSAKTRDLQCARESTKQRHFSYKLSSSPTVRNERDNSPKKTHFLWSLLTEKKRKKKKKSKENYRIFKKKRFYFCFVENTLKKRTSESKPHYTVTIVWQRLANRASSHENTSLLKIQKKKKTKPIAQLFFKKKGE